MKWILVVFLLFSFTGCLWSDKGPESIIIIAVEGLDSESIPCASEDVEKELFGFFARFQQRERLLKQQQFLFASIFGQELKPWNR